MTEMKQSVDAQEISLLENLFLITNIKDFLSIYIAGYAAVFPSND